MICDWLWSHATIGLGLSHIATGTLCGLHPHLRGASQLPFLADNVNWADNVGSHPLAVKVTCLTCGRPSTLPQSHPDFIAK